MASPARPAGRRGRPPIAAGVVDTGARSIVSPLARRMGVELAGVLPSVVHLPPRGFVDQGELECCVSCALAATVEVLYGDPPRAPLFHYHAVRAGHLVGMTIEDGIAALRRAGICDQPRHPAPFTPEGARTAPSAEARREAGGWRDTRLRTSESITGPLPQLFDPQREVEWKRTLAEGRPILIEFELTEAYGPGLKRLDRPGKGTGRLHAAVVIGYEDRERAFIVHDSRGPEWFVGGQWWLPYEVALTPLVRRAFAPRRPRGG